MGDGLFLWIISFASSRIYGTDTTEHYSGISFSANIKLRLQNEVNLVYEISLFFFLSVSQMREFSNLAYLSKWIKYETFRYDKC